MSLVQNRGGVPRVLREALTTAKREWHMPFSIWYLKVRVDAATRLFFTEEDADNDANYVAIPAPAAATPYGEWEGPVEADKLWFKAVATSNIEAVAFQRRG